VIVDASALLSVVLAEDDARSHARAMAAAASCRISAVNWLEAAAVADRRDDPVVSARFDEVVRSARLEIAPVTAEQALLAREAYRRFGRRRHPARLNLADCFAYALAKAERQPLLFKGRDFSQTDIEPALKD